jgi:hypothetical protein
VEEFGVDTEKIEVNIELLWIHKDVNNQLGRMLPYFKLSKGVKAIYSIFWLWSRHIQNFVRFEVFLAVTMKNGVSFDVTPCGSCNNRRFGGT